MRMFLALLLILFAAPALAQDWETYENARYGYAIAVPPGFNWGAEAQNGDGRAFRDGPTQLSVWGGMVTEDSFDAAVADAATFLTNDGWNLTYKAVTPGWASLSGTNDNNRVIYTRIIAVCGGTQYAAFQLLYSLRDMAALDPVVNRLVQSLRPTGAC